jgi:hypothetical protein
MSPCPDGAFTGNVERCTVGSRAEEPGGVEAGSPYRNVRPQKIKNGANERDVFMGMGSFASITPPQVFSLQKNPDNFQGRPFFAATLGHEHRLQTLGK